MKMLCEIVHQLFDAIEELIPGYMANPEDSILSDGNVSVCVMDEAGNVYGKMYGSNKLESRRTYKIAWTKASQVWITSIATNEYERMVFNNEIDESVFGIETPDLIGWLGGQPVVLKDGTKLAVGFSGFRGCVDLEIVQKALKSLDL